MQIDPSVLQAFAVLEHAFDIEFLSRPPSRHNLEYRAWLERMFMRRIGMALPTLPDTRQRTWTAHLMLRFFWRDLGLRSRPELLTELPMFLWRPDYALPPVDVDAIADSLATIEQTEPAPLCIAERRMALLIELLHLSPADSALLQLAYAACHWGLPTSSEPYAADQHALQAVLNCLHWRDLAERNRVFAMLLAVSVEEAAALFDAPITVVALQLIDNDWWHKSRNALAFATATDKLVALLEAQYQTHAALLADLQMASPDIGMAFDSDYPADLLYEELPLSVANAYMAARRGHALNAAQLLALVWWQTQLELAAEVVQPLADKLDFETVVRVLIRATLNCRTSGGSLTKLRLLQALYAAA